VAWWLVEMFYADGADPAAECLRQLRIY
jgi:hypothetical protein